LQARAVTLATIGRFQVERAVGSGTFATVWLARDPDLEAWVAIKLLAENWSMNQDARRRFMEEARAMRLLDDDRIVRVYEVGRLDDGRPYMVMEFADRGTLEDRMRLRAQLDQPFTVAEAVSASMEIAECLVAVHDHRIVHRDIKPSNVLFRSSTPERKEAMRREGRPVRDERTLLGDFGIARRLEGVLGPTMVLGSPQYMAPEQGDPDLASTVDGRSDVYSGAVVLYELLAGRVPVRVSSIGELQQAERRPGPPSIRSFRPDISPALAEVIHRGLSPRKEDRQATAREWRDELRSALAVSSVDMPAAAAPAARMGGSNGAGAPAAPRAGPAGEGGQVTRPAQPAAVAGTIPVRPAATAREPVRPDTAVLVPARPDPSAVPDAPEVDAAAAVRATLLPVRVSGLFAMVASAALLISLLLSWAVVRPPRGTEEVRLGMAFRGGNVVAVAAVVAFVAGLALWRTGRRFVARVASIGAVAAGVGSLAVAAYEFAEIRAHVRTSFGSRGASVGVRLGFGLDVVAVAGVVAALMGWFALGRVRYSRRLDKHPALRTL